MHRTGTTTLAECLRLLGYRHAPYAGELLGEVLAGRPDGALAMLPAWDSFNDWPWPRLYRQLDEACPDARFVLTLRRNTDTWFRSVCGHAQRTGPTEERRLLYGHPDPQGRRREYAAVYERHNRDVMQYFAGRPESLLTVCWETGSGWSSLCAFLGVEVPQRPLPHARRGSTSKARKPAAGEAGAAG